MLYQDNDVVRVWVLREIGNTDFICKSWQVAALDKPPNVTALPVFVLPRMVAAMARKIQPQGLEPILEIQRRIDEFCNAFTPFGRDVRSLYTVDDVIRILQARRAGNASAHDTSNPLVLAVVSVADDILSIITRDKGIVPNEPR